MSRLIHSNEGDWELFHILGRDALFSNYRIDKSTVPEGLYAYDLRDADDQSGTPSEIAESVLVNHMGTVIVKEPIENIKNGIELTPDDYNFIGDEISLRDFIDGNYDDDGYY